MTKAEKLNSLKTLLNDMASNSWTEVKRKEIISAAISSGLDEKDTYVALKPISKSSTKGCYTVAEMLTLVEGAMRKLIEGAMNKSVPAKKAKKVATVAAKSSPNAKETISASSGVYAYDALPYTQDDMAEELSLMGTYM